MESINKTVALLPIRGGSKGVINKNIKRMGEYPLFLHILLSAVACPLIDTIFIATDIFIVTDIIEKELGVLPLDVKKKIKVIERSKESCEDDAATEVVMLEFAQKYDFENIILLQATSPLTRSADITKGIKHFYEGKYDSVLSVTVNKKFHWDYATGKNDEVNPTNYNIYNRLQRQNLNLGYNENGAFYITTKKNLLENKCRLSGKIGISIMDEITGIEIDELSDWIMINSIFKNYKRYNEQIKLFVMDCDGVMTDGKIFLSGENVTQKSFNVIDGEGIALLHEHGIKTIVLTKESSNIDGLRNKKLNVDQVCLGITDKFEVLEKICQRENVNLCNVAYVGDDISDFIAMKNVGISFAPRNAQKIIKKNASVCLKHNGGDGAIREAVNYILTERMY